MFIVPKKEGKYRLVVNLKPLNRFMRQLHFEIEGSVPAEGEWIDLKGAYGLCGKITVPFQCIPFGLRTAPCVFTKVLRPVMSLIW